MPATSTERPDHDRGRAGYTRFCWTVLAFNLFVIVWGALVRASGSGAGCGSHWPLCNGEVVPRSPAFETVIELSHRLTSGLALILVIAMVLLAWRRFPRRHLVRRAAATSLVLILMEALIGAGLVLLEYVADDTSAARGYWVGGHLINTFLLVASLSLTAWWAGGHPGPSLRGHPTRIPAVLGVAALAVLALSTSGAITALGDTLFPVQTFAEGKRLTFAADAHIFVRLRIWHPTMAIAVGMILSLAAYLTTRSSGDRTVRRWARWMVGLYAAQLALGLLNMWLLAPIALQLAHLLLADLIWIALVLMAASALSAPTEAPATGRQS